MSGCPLLLVPFNNRVWLTAAIVLAYAAGRCVRAVTVAANTPGLYNNYYNSGFASTPITGLPNYTSLIPANSSFDYGVTGQAADPQQSTSDTYCGGVFSGYLYTTITRGEYIVGVQSKDGFSLTLNGYTIASNSKLVTQRCARLLTPLLMVCRSVS